MNNSDKITHEPIIEVAYIIMLLYRPECDEMDQKKYITQNFSEYVILLQPIDNAKEDYLAPVVVQNMTRAKQKFVSYEL